MKKQIFSSLILLVILTSLVFADGGMIIHRPDGWQLHPEERQLCAINYENGYQNMILSINFDSDTKGGDKAVWIFPIPAKPEDTVVDVIKGFPQFYGYDIKQQAKNKISNNFQMMRATQIYPLFLTRNIMYAAKSFEQQVGGIMDNARAKEPSMYIYEHIEKMGLTTELVRVKDGKVLEDYFKAKSLVIPSDAKKVFDEYIGNDYIFVISWIYDLEKLKQEQANYEKMPYYGSQTNLVGVSLTFPTDKIYFPLKPTSIYGSKSVPATIYVTGYVTPVLYDSIKSSTQVEYLYQGYYSVPENINTLFSGKAQIDNLKYTKITMNPPSKYLKEDLYFENKAPAVIRRAEFFINYSKTLGWSFFIICSILASLIAALIAFRKDAKLLTFTLFGLTNILTIIGVIVGIIILKTKEIDQKLKDQIKKAGVAITMWDKRKLLFVILFSIIFMILTIILEKVILTSLN
jgi:hypothetical protein